MGHTSEVLRQVRLQAQGEWYPARQVNALLEELSACAEEDARRGEALERDAQALRERVQRLEGALKRAGQRTPGFSQEAVQRRVCEVLELERDGLIQDIKALRHYRESYRQAVEEEARKLLVQFGVTDPPQS